MGEKEVMDQIALCTDISLKWQKELHDKGVPFNVIFTSFMNTAISAAVEGGISKKDFTTYVESTFDMADEFLKKGKK